jgi:GTP pyrophosphokinase
VSKFGPPAASFDGHLLRMIRPWRGSMSGQAKFPDSGLSVKLSRTQIDRLGDRLRSTSATQDDLMLLDEFRRSFGSAYEVVVQCIQDLKLEPTGRPAKSTPSVIEKLKRETMRLTQMQDIAGCRVVVPDIVEQDRIVDSLVAVFPGTPVTDRRSNPSYGYCAVHLVV